MSTPQVLISTLLILGLSSAQQDVYTAYAPGSGSGDVPGAYRSPTPRLVAVKVRVRNSPKFYFEEEEEELVGSEGRNVRIINSPPQQYYFYGQQPGESYPQQRILRTRPQYATPQYLAAAQQPVQSVYANKDNQPQVLPQFQYVTSRAHAQPLAPVYRPQQVYRQAPAVQQQRPVLRAQKEELIKEEQEPEYPSDPNPQYNFAFDVKDDDFTNYQNRQESKEGGITKGSYSVVDPDGYVRTVTYTASPKGGFVAKVTREPTDVKIKFPVPTQAPQEEQKRIYHQPQYAPNNGGGATYVPRRSPHRLAPQYSQQQ